MHAWYFFISLIQLLMTHPSKKQSNEPAVADASVSTKKNEPAGADPFLLIHRTLPFAIK